MKKAFGSLATGVAVGIAVTLIMRPSTFDGRAPESTGTFASTTATAEGREVVRLASRLADVETQSELDTDCPRSGSIAT
jgi:hypothetical protein